MQPPDSHRVFLLAFIAALLLSAGVLVLQWPSSVTPRDAPADVFSGERAVDALTRLLDAAGGGPHPVGSDANARLHRALVAELEALGWEVELQRGVGCRNLRTCAAVENVIARRPGRGTGPAVMVGCHTDSVAAGPGASDDGAGMATMVELARNLAAAPDLDRPVWLLFNEGEEMGLLGADLFTRTMEPGSVGAVVNLEARGTEGPVWFFEISDGGGALVDAYARSVPRPTTSSVAYSVYRRMPNDTDLTVFRGAGLPGLGLAYIDGGARYHTLRDDLDHLSTASVERMGQATLGLVRNLASRELPPAAKETVFFDVAALFTMHWPAALSLPLALVAALLLAVGARRRVGPLELLGGAGAWLLAAVAAGLGGALVYFGLRAVGALPMAFPANLATATAAAALTGTSAALLSARAFSLNPTARLYGVLAGLTVLG
ncbi:MAG: M20/M25/M40 family metallo-hydrolase, partial [Acidobacteriota bacterium]